MGFSVNKVTLLGRLGNDPEFRQIKDDSALATFSLATDQSYKDESGEWKSKTEWHRITAWGKLAEMCNKHLKKGSKVYLEGSIHTQQYEKDGEKKYTTNIRVKEIVLLDKKEGQNPGGNDSMQDAPGPSQSGEMEDLPF